MILEAAAPQGVVGVPLLRVNELEKVRGLRMMDSV